MSCVVLYVYDHPLLVLFFFPSSTKTGFGWTSGVVLHLLALYPDMSLTDDELGLVDEDDDLSVNDELLTVNNKTGSRHILSVYSPDYSLEGDLAVAASNTTTNPPSRASLGWVAAPVLLVIVLVVLMLCLAWCRWLFVAGERRYWSRVQNEHLQAAGGGGGEGQAISPATSRGRESSEETDEHNDSDRRELFTWDV